MVKKIQLSVRRTKKRKLFTSPRKPERQVLSSMRSNGQPSFARNSSTPLPESMLGVALSRRREACQATPVVLAEFDADENARRGGAAHLRSGRGLEPRAGERVHR